ncbi:MAG: zf-HC2 domain-containing protein [Acidobacteriota bacterium]
MDCKDIQPKISEWIDQDLDHSDEALVRGHIELCKECSQLHYDLESLKQSVAILDPFEPPDTVWTGIKAQLITEGLIERESVWNFWKNFFPSTASLKPALSGALVTLIMVTSLYFFFGRGGREPIPPPALPEVAAFEDLKTAELKYEQAIEELSRVSQRKLAALSPELAQIFNDNLATMDYYLNECRQAMQNDPENPLVHRYLLAAYQKKVDLLKTISTSDSL